MFELLRNYIAKPALKALERDLEAKYQMLRFADFWHYLGWIIYYEKAYLELRNKWEKQAYDPENIYRLVKKHILRK